MKIQDSNTSSPTRPGGGNHKINNKKIIFNLQDRIIDVHESMSELALFALFTSFTQLFTPIGFPCLRFKRVHTVPRW